MSESTEVPVAKNAEAIKAEVVITESAVIAAVDAALAAIEAAGDSAALRAVRTAHTGEASPLGSATATAGPQLSGRAR